MRQPRHREGQIAPFIMIAVTIVVLFSIYAFQRNRTLAEQETPSPEESLAPARAILRDCFEQSSKEAVQDIGRGGRIAFSHPIQLYDGTIEAMFIDGASTLPSITQLEQEASAQIDYATGECFAQAAETNPRIAKVTIGTVQSRLTFTEDRGMIAARIPLQTTGMPDVSFTEGFNAEVPVRMPIMLETAATLISEARNDPTHISPELLFSQPVRVILETAGKGIFLYRLIDKTSIIDQEPFEYRLAITMKEGGP